MPIPFPGASETRATARPRMRIVALATYPAEGASTRFRILQYIPALDANGVDVTLLPFVDRHTFDRLYERRAWFRNAASLLLALLRRILQLPMMFRADAIFVQREAMLFGPPLIEWLVTKVARRPMVLDLDDPTYIEQVSPVYGRLATILKWPGKTNWLIDHSSMVICGNTHIAEYVRGRNVRAVILQTIIDTSAFSPALPLRSGGETPVIGWVGSHSTFPYFESIVPALETLARELPFRVRIVGSGRDAVTIAGVEVETLAWRLDREIADFQHLDIGVYPLPKDSWAEGKSGLKAIEYLSVGVPFVASPVGVLTEIGEEGRTHFFAKTEEEWKIALGRLLRDPSLRKTMGAAGREYALAHYSVQNYARRIAEWLRELCFLDAASGSQRH